MNASLSPAEELRLQALQDYAILDTPPEKDFDELTFLAAQICGTPIAMITLVDDNRLWFKAKVGIEHHQMECDQSFCKYTIASDDVFVIPDAAIDPRFADNPYVTGPTSLRFYAGSPLITPTGVRIGALCVVDRVARTLTESQEEALRVLSRQVVAQLENRRSMRELAERERTLENALEELKTYQIRALTIYDSVLDSVVVTDADGIVESCNSSVLSMFGYSKEEFPGYSFDVLLAEAQGAEWDTKSGEIAAFLQAEADETRQRGGFGHEVIGRRRNDEFFPLDITVSKVLLKDRHLFIAVMRDMSERKRIDLLKHEFISVVSHELRTPLTSIHGSLSLLQGGIAGELPEQFRKLLHIALKNSERLTRLINDILDIEKIEAGKMDFRLRPLPLLPWLENQLETNRAYADQLDVKLRLTVAPDVPTDLKVMADSERLAQVMTNLLSNAAKFSPPNETVTVTVEYEASTAEDAADLSDTSASSRLRISVSDNGPGISTEFRPHVFEKFVQADSAETRRKGGTGLGLSITRAIIEKMGGHIDYESIPGEGATFFFDIPVLLAGSSDFATDDVDNGSSRNTAGSPSWNGRFVRGLPAVKAPVIQASGRDATATAVAERPANDEMSQLRILLCEDDPDLVQLLSVILADVAETVFAMTLREARDRLEEEQFDLVILDPGLPDGSGLVLLPELNGKDGPPVIIFSAANVDAESARQAASTLVKSRHSHHDLLLAIRDVLTTENGGSVRTIS